MVAFSLLLVFASDYEVFKLSDFFFFNLASVLAVHQGIYSNLRCYGGKWTAVSQQRSGLCLGLLLVATGGHEGQCGVAGPGQSSLSWLRPWDKRKHKCWRDGISL